MWFGQLPDRWDSKRVAAMFASRSEKNNPIKTDFILSLSAKNGVMPYSERTEKGGNKPKDDLSKYSIAHKNDLLINCMNVLAGSSGVTKWDGAISPVYYALYPHHENINVWYYHYIFRLVTFYRSLIGLGKGILFHESESGSLNTIRLRISMTSLNNVVLPLPPREEQDQIVRYLDWKVSQINKLIHAKRQQIDLLYEKKQATIGFAVTNGVDKWREMRLGNHGIFRKGFGGSRVDDDTNGVACIRYGDIYRSGALFLDQPITRINRSVVDSYARTRKLDVLFALSGETKEEIGQALMNNIDENTWCSGDAAIFSANNDILPQFLVYALRCPHVVKQRAGLARGDIIVHISTGALRRLKIFVPPIDCQNDIVMYLNRQCENIDKITAGLHYEITLLNEYRTRLIFDVVTGKRDVRSIVVPDYDAADNSFVVDLGEDDNIDESEE